MSSQRYLVFESKHELDKHLPIGSKLKVRIKGKPICIVRKEPKGLIAFEDECPHMSESLYTGSLNHLNEIVCPWHSYRFNLETGAENENKCASLNFYEVSENDGGYYLVI